MHRSETVASQPLSTSSRVQQFIAWLSIVRAAIAGASARRAHRARTLLGRVAAPRLRRLCADAGMTTAEYAIGTLAACGFAALLVTILRSGTVRGLLLALITKALALGG